MQHRRAATGQQAWSRFEVAATPAVLLLAGRGWRVADDVCACSLAALLAVERRDSHAVCEPRRPAEVLRPMTGLGR